MRTFGSVLGVGITVTLIACSSDDSSSSSSQTPFPPSSCTDGGPCTVGQICMGPVESACNGTWYCWSDTNWHCAPPDSGGPGGFPDATAGEPDASQEASPATDAPAAPDAPGVTDAPGGG